MILNRHNGNILLDLQGHITHIDFGFMLMNSPGSVGFELAPFKLPQEYIDVIGGYNSPKFQEFRELVKMGFLALRKRSEGVIGMVEVMEKDSRLPCFTGVTNPAAVPLKVDTKYNVTQSLRERFNLAMTDDAFCEFVDELIDSSCNNVFTKLYDTFQVSLFHLVLRKWNTMNIVDIKYHKSYDYNIISTHHNHTVSDIDSVNAHVLRQNHHHGNWRIHHYESLHRN
jgi:phosphatidylinositol kinase/protein kinase (PI-3  family)